MENSDFRLVDPVKPLAAYIGGKRNLAERIAKRIDAVPHDTYAEPFVGMGGIFLRRSRAPKAEVINDLSGDVIGFFRVLQRHYIAFVDFLRFQITSRREFERLVRTDPSTLTDLERAARFLYLQRTAFGGKVVGRHFGVQHGRAARFDVTALGPLLEAVHERLAGVVIECLPYGDLIHRYDRPATLFYLDPPYHGTEEVYGQGAFSQADYGALAEIIAGMDGRVIMSINDTPFIRSCFSRLEIEEINTSYSLAAKGSMVAKELLITNFAPEAPYGTLRGLLRAD